MYLEVGYCWDLRDSSFYRFRAHYKEKVGKIKILVTWLPLVASKRGHEEKKTCSNLPHMTCFVAKHLKFDSC